MIFPVEPILNHRIWGGDFLKQCFSRNDGEEKIGEVFLVSCMVEADSLIDGIKLSSFYQKYSQYFDISLSQFPLRINLIDACDDLSIQLHPLAKTLMDPNLPKGMEEAWYVISANEESRVILGVGNATKDEIKQEIANDRWENLWHYSKVQAGDFMFLKAGLVHAIGKGTLIYEVTCNHDITYRVYDYQRIDPKTNKQRVLHQQQALENIDIQATSEIIATNEYDDVELVKNNHGFQIKKICCVGKRVIEIDNFYFCTIVKGVASIDGYVLDLYHTYFLPKTNKSFIIEGNCQLLMTTYSEDEIYA